MPYFTHEFTAPLVIHRIGHLRYRVVFPPEHLERELPFGTAPRLRMTGEVNDYPIDAAWLPAGEGAAGGHYLLLSAAFCKTAGLELGQPVDVRFNLADPDAVNVPDELAEALRQAGRRANREWTSLTPGKQRGLCAHVASARTTPTRVKRSAMIVEALAEGRDPLPHPSRRKR
jgi:hypothetical protein